jgi:abortive infection bacteriophage resistance protein
MLYTILKDQDKDEIAAVFGVPASYMDDFLPILSNYRNLCAHEDIVFDHKTEKYIADTEYHEKLKIFKMDDEYIYGKNDLFAVVIIFKYLLTDDDFRLFMKEFEYEIEAMDGKIDTIPNSKILDHMGFPKNYMDIVDL